MATQTFLNEQESAAMPGMACHPSEACLLVPLGRLFKLSTLYVHWICDRERGGDLEITVGYL